MTYAVTKRQNLAADLSKVTAGFYESRKQGYINSLITFFKLEEKLVQL